MNRPIVDPTQPIDYSDSSKLPTTYGCGACNQFGIKLWRTTEMDLDNQVLRCATCAASETQVDISSMKHDGYYTNMFGYITSEINGFVPAIPTPRNDNFWQFTTTPGEALSWWVRLPLR